MCVLGIVVHVYLIATRMHHRRQLGENYYAQAVIEEQFQRELANENYFYLSTPFSSVIINDVTY